LSELPSKVKNIYALKEYFSHLDEYVKDRCAKSCEVKHPFKMPEINTLSSERKEENESA